MKRTLRYVAVIWFLAQAANVWAMSDAEKKKLETQIKNLDKAQVHKIVTAVEADPLSEMAEAMRPALIIYFEDIPYHVCLDQLGPLVGSKSKLHQDVFFQVVFSSGDFILQHPESAIDEYAYQLAGLEGALRVYERILAAKPKVRLDFLDRLLEQRDSGRLGEHIKANPCPAH